MGLGLLLREGGGQWHTFDGGLVLTSIEGERTFEWLVGFPGSASWDWREFESLSVAPGESMGS